MNDVTHKLPESGSLPLKRMGRLKRLFALILVGALAIAPLADAATINATPDVRNTKASRVVAQFMKAFVAKDIRSVMRVVAVPFFLEDKKNITILSELRKEFANVFERGDSTTIKYSLGKVQAFSAVKKKGNAKVRERLEEVLDDDDRLVEVAMSSQSKEEKLSVLVSFRNSRVRVVGFRF